MSTASPEYSAAQSQNIVSQIRDLLPLQRHAVFHVKLTIHQLSNVPLISGQFRIKWKFRNLQVVNSAGRPLGLGRALARKLEKRKGKEVSRSDTYDERDPEELDSDSPKQEQSSITNGRPASINSSGQSSHSKRSSLNAPASESKSVDYTSDARGFTPFLHLRDFKVVFDYQMDVAIQISVDKDSLALNQSELKLTVMQRVIHGDPDSPRNPRLGHVEINLAEYANVGPVTRNYLLRRSKVNAMLNMTITMTQLFGEENFRAPPLRKEEIGAGISHFLTMSKPLPPLSRFTSTEDPWLADSLNLFLSPQEEDLPPAEHPPDIPYIPSPGKKRLHGIKHTTSSGTDNPPSPKPIIKERLNPTEALIEAIFNPYPTTSTKPSPFTYYVPSAPEKSDSTGTDSTSRWSFESSPQASASEQGYEAMSRLGNGSGNKRWRVKIGTGSRPVTPRSTES